MCRLFTTPVSGVPALGRPLPDGGRGAPMCAPLSRIVQWFKTMTANEYTRGVIAMPLEPSRAAIFTVFPIRSNRLSVFYRIGPQKNGAKRALIRRQMQERKEKPSADQDQAGVNPLSSLYSSPGPGRDTEGSSPTNASGFFTPSRTSVSRSYHPCRARKFMHSSMV